MRRRIERRRRNVRSRDHLAVAMQLKWRGAAGRRIVARQPGAADVVGMLLLASFKGIARAADDLWPRRQNTAINRVRQISRCHRLVIKTPGLDVAERHE